MLNRLLLLTIVVLMTALLFPVGTAAQNYPKVSSPDGWPAPSWEYPPLNAQNRKPAPARDLTGMWGPLGGHMGGVQAGGVLAKPNNGRPENQLPYTTYGLELYKQHKAAEGADAVLPAENNDPRNKCEPLGIPRYNHYNVRLTQIFQDPTKVVILYHYDNRWRIIWTDGRKLPKLLDGGVEIDGQYREQRIFGYSIGRWVNDTTLEVQTIGTYPEDRVWLDSTGRPISDQVKITETFRRVSLDELEWSETIDDPKVYSKPWETMRLQMRLHDPHTDVMEYYCSPAEAEQYNKFFGNDASHTP
ncbi:MAG TPA: hypothetical protein VFO31_13060 [Vicinamibacterales bacterium]|nr:hypothetical protein [Vicinamibacterales bacterium]